MAEGAAAGANATRRAEGDSARRRTRSPRTTPSPTSWSPRTRRNLDTLRAFIAEARSARAAAQGDAARRADARVQARRRRGRVPRAGRAHAQAANWHATYYVDPIDPTWPADKVESYLRGQNNYEVQLVASHEAYPGHHTQYFYSKRNLNPLRAVLWNAPMVEGWAVYGEGLMVGLGSAATRTIASAFYDLRGQMIVADQRAARHQAADRPDDRRRGGALHGRGGLPASRRRPRRSSCAPSSTRRSCASTSSGSTRSRRSRPTTARRWAREFNQRAFNEALIGHGSIAVKFLRDYVLK